LGYRFGMSTARRRFSLEGRLVLLTAIPVFISVSVAVGLAHWLGTGWLEWAVALAISIPLIVVCVRLWVEPVLSLFRALSGAVASFRDRDFSFGIVRRANDELGDLVVAHNELAQTLRQERQNLFQRELLLDTVIQNTPVALLLTEPRGHVVYGNLAARQLFNDGRRLEGRNLADLMEQAPSGLREAFVEGRDRLFTFEYEGHDETYHLSRRAFNLNGRAHNLHLLKRLTVELSRQEVATWKKVIRVISHELNNSLAPISSLAHSGAELAKRGDTERLAKVFATIEERARHLDSFIRGYADFAKLPTPRLEAVEWSEFLSTLQSHYPFRLEGDVPREPAQFDPAQMQQALINLLKNAHESGSAPGQVSVSMRRIPGGVKLEVADRGTGMSEAVLANALVPFYSTKRSGTGLGLALAREIVEAHGGRLTLSNREGGGLGVGLSLPSA
jgi:nitrogen fixation/metabolism regulation signal transduction histidine kinase